MLLAAALTLASFSVYAVLVNLMPLLLERGLTMSTAALALALGGVGQVVVRLGYGRLVAASTVRTRTLLVLGACAAGTALLAAVPGSYAAVFALLAGIGAVAVVLAAVESPPAPDDHRELVGTSSASSQSTDP